MNQPLISVILPIYNVENYIHECLNSLLNQTIGYENLEVIMVNDCSTDRTSIIIDEYATKYQNFISIHLSENTGSPSIPKNKGTEIAKGKYLIFLDPDDVLPNDAYETLYNTAIETDSYFVMANIERFTSIKRWKQPQLNIPLLQRKHLGITIEEKPEFLSVLGYMVNKLIKTSYFKELSLSFDPTIKLGEDFILSNLLMLHAKKFSYIPDTVYYYRMREDEDENSLTQLPPNQAMRNFVNVDNKLYDEYVKNNLTDLYKYSNLQTVKSILYRFNEEFFEYNYDEQLELIKLVQPAFNRFDNELIDEVPELDQGTILFFNYDNFDYLIKYLQLKYDRDLAYQEWRSNERSYRVLKNIYKSTSWKITSPLRSGKKYLTNMVGVFINVMK